MLIKKIKNITLINISKFLFTIKNIYYRIKNHNKKKIFIFTDSRGYEVTKPWNKKNPFSSYIGSLIKKYNVEYHICEESSTTIIDFLYSYQNQIKKGKQYDIIIAQIGLVDFSPRPKTMLKTIIEKKKNKINDLNLDINYFYNRLNNDVFEEIYYNEELSNLYSLDYFKSNIIPLLLSINNFIYIGCNPILHNWKGNYWKNRPRDINIILDYSKLLESHLSPQNVISLLNWNEKEIMKRTVDNIHLNKYGYIYLDKILKKKINEVSQ
ncbi:hypothetical protein ACUMKS_002197 [Proteus mirabilis]|uniref:hypothetical protein n=1 Tax=Proteus mirabilis TaxID=584 RepID=UPI0018C4CD7E|nr:hypothetical protein [Proteus mirabilis]HCT9024701.1 hypothetical protein [Proteus mirabilis]